MPLCFRRLYGARRVFMRLISSFIFAGLLAVCAAAWSLAGDEAKPVKLYGVIGLVDELQTSFSDAGVTLSKKSLPASIIDVRPGSVAIYAGLRSNDKVLKYSLIAGRLEVTIDRDGRLYAVPLGRFYIVGHNKENFRQARSPFER